MQSPSNGGDGGGLPFFNGDRQPKGGKLRLNAHMRCRRSCIENIIANERENTGLSFYYRRERGGNRMFPYCQRTVSRGWWRPTQ